MQVNVLNESFEIKSTISKVDIKNKFELVIKEISDYSLTDIKYYEKNESKLLDFIKNNYSYLTKNRNKITDFYCPDLITRYLIVKDVETDSLMFKAPEVIISYAIYIAKIKSIFLCIEDVIQL